jgi:cell shape-determining protein MreC
MLSWILQITIISIVLIFLVHYLINFFKSTLTIPKIKDLVNSPTQKYENMFNIISKNNFKMNNNENTNNENTNKMEIEYTLTDLLPKPDTDMKNELKKFLKKQMNPTDDTSNTTSISALDSMMSNSYSDFSS